MPIHELDFGETGSWVYLQGKDSLMMQAAFRNNIDGLEFAINDEYHKQWLNGKNVRGCSALRLAATSGHVEACKFLVEHDADIDILDCRWQTPLAVAVKHNKPECAEYLLSQGAMVDGDPMSACTPLYSATYEHNLESLKILCKYRANLDRSSIVPGKYTISPLFHAVNTQKKDIFRFLLLAGADPEYNCTTLSLMYKHVRGGQSLYFTCVEKNCDVDYAVMLFNMGANLYRRDHKNRLCIDDTIMDRFHNPVNPVKEYIKSIFHKTHSLQSVCRITIRRAMGRWDIQERIPGLPLPNFLKDYLLHKETEPKVPPPKEEEESEWYYETVNKSPYIPRAEWSAEQRPENKLKDLQIKAKERREREKAAKEKQSEEDEMEQGVVGGSDSAESSSRLIVDEVDLEGEGARPRHYGMRNVPEEESYKYTQIIPKRKSAFDALKHTSGPVLIGGPGPNDSVLLLKRKPRKEKEETKKVLPEENSGGKKAEGSQNSQENGDVSPGDEPNNNGTDGKRKGSRKGFLSFLSQDGPMIKGPKITDTILIPKKPKK